MVLAEYRDDREQRDHQTGWSLCYLSFFALGVDAAHDGCSCGRNGASTMLEEASRVELSAQHPPAPEQGGVPIGEMRPSGNQTGVAPQISLALDCADGLRIRGLLSR